MTTADAYNSSFSPEQQNNSNDNNWRDYRNTSVVTSEMFSHGNIPPLNHSLNNSQNFDMYNQAQNFQPGKYLFLFKCMLRTYVSYRKPI